MTWPSTDAQDQDSAQYPFGNQNDNPNNNQNSNQNNNQNQDQWHNHQGQCPSCAHACGSYGHYSCHASHGCGHFSGGNGHFHGCGCGFRSQNGSGNYDIGPSNSNVSQANLGHCWRGLTSRTLQTNAHLTDFAGLES